MPDPIILGAGLGWAGLAWAGESSVLTYCCHHHLTPTFLSTCPLQTSIPMRNGVTAVIMIIEVHHVRLVDTFMVTAERLSYFQFLFSIIILCLWGLISVVDNIRNSKSTQPLSRHLLVIGDLHLSFAFCIVIHSQSSKSRIQWNPSCISAFSVGWQMMRLYLWFYYIDISTIFILHCHRHWCSLD